MRLQRTPRMSTVRATGANVIVYYRDESSGQRVAKHFKRVS